MPRTITGTYTLKPNKYVGYFSSGTFTNYFKALSVDSGAIASGGYPAGGWTNSFSSHGDTIIGDASDNTYLTMSPPSSFIGWTSKCKGYNACYQLSVTSGTVPDVAYTITSVTLVARDAAQSNNTGTAHSAYYYSMTGSSTSSYTYKWSRFDDADDSPTDKTYTSSTTTSMSANTHPERVALCIAGSRQVVSNMGWVRCYEITCTISYQYTEYEKSVNYYDDDGVSVTSNGAGLTTGSTYQDYKGSQYPLIATVQPGYVFDGYYLNGSLVSSTLNYTYTFNGDGDKLYCITKVRKVFDGTTQVNEIYVGTDAISEVYIGTAKVWGESDLKANAIAGV